ncbi:MAG TPA: replicative DNA helicase [Candidatus Limnocylindria bacterium]|nr:replicative DNA helicase [Candidatus Limnocylindria bacterium]
MTLEATTESVVPHDRAAEQQVLGSLLIDRDAIFKVADTLRVDDFYVPAHQRVYDAVLALLERRERIDALTLQVELARREMLDLVGGSAYLRELAEVVATAVEVDRHARAVRDKAVLRRLLGAARGISADAYDEPTDIPLTLDRAEQRIFALGEQARNAQLRHIFAALQTNYEHLTERMEHPFDVSGVASGFREIDGYTEGFGAGDLVILAARPSVGKTSLALAIAMNVARRGETALVFSLEMDAKQIVARFIGMNSSNDLLSLRTGLIDPEASSALMGLPILIDDTPGISVMELRTKARRAAAQGRLGIVVVDYLQLVRTGQEAENRVQELSIITRNLVSLGRELGVPILALSQLSRAAGDAGSEPKLSTLRECVPGHTLVQLTDGRRVPICDLVGQTPEVWSVDERGKIVAARAEAVWKVGTRALIEVRLASGRTFQGTLQHRVMTLEGWAPLAHLLVGDRIALARKVPEPPAPKAWPELRLALLGQLIGDGSYLANQALRYTTSSIDNSMVVAEAATLEFDAKVTCIRGRGTWHQLLISGNGTSRRPAGVNRWLRDLGVFGQRSFQKRVPVEVFELSVRQIALFLRHLWATDGCIGVRTGRGGHAIYYATNSPGLATDVGALLLRLGIVSRTARVKEPGYRDGYQVHVSGTTDQKRFLDLVGAFGPRVTDALALRGALAGIEPNTNVDTIPIEVFDRVRARMREVGVTTREMTRLRGTAYGGMSHFRFAPSRGLLDEYATLLDDDGLRALARNDLFWDKVVGLDVVEDAEVYDLTVPGPASWLADAVVSHNSGAIEQDSSTVIMLWRDKEDAPPGAPKVIHGSIAKNRNGPTGVFTLLFEAEQARFFSKAPDEDMPV